MLLSAPRAKCPLPDVCAVTTSPGAVRATNTTSPLLLPTPSPPAAIESIETLTAAISRADPQYAQLASTIRARHRRPVQKALRHRKASRPRALHGRARPIKRRRSPRRERILRWADDRESRRAAARATECRWPHAGTRRHP